jgi:hypothetical protein
MVRRCSRPTRSFGIGQMLDYAANAVAYWPVEETLAKFEICCEKEGHAADAVLTPLLGEGYDIDAFRQRVKTNLQAGRICMVYLAVSTLVEVNKGTNTDVRRKVIGQMVMS